MPGVLLIESDGADLRLAGDRAHALRAHAVPRRASRKPSCAPSSRPAQRSRSRRKIMHEGSGFAVTEAEITVDGKPICNADITFRVVRFPEAANSAPTCDDVGRAHRVPDGGRWPMADARARGLDHRHRHRLLPRRRAGRALAGAAARHSRAPTTTTFAPYIIHPLAPLNFDKQIPKKGDQRQMEPWQRIGTYAAGLALDCRRHQRQRRDARRAPT